MGFDFDEKSFVEEYVHAFEARDGRCVAAFYNAPCLSVRADGSMHSFSTHKEIEAFFTSVLETYAEEGMTTFCAAAVTADPIGSMSSRFTCAWSMKRKDGSIIRNWSQTYIFQKFDADWKIIASIFHL
jgi:ketosteroid isomerase-like protein